jgi:hypothetical protein
MYISQAFMTFRIPRRLLCLRRCSNHIPIAILVIYSWFSTSSGFSRAAGTTAATFVPGRRQQLRMTQRFDQQVGDGVVKEARVKGQKSANDSRNRQSRFLSICHLSICCVSVDEAIYIELTLFIVGSKSNTFNERALRGFVAIGLEEIVLHIG